MDFNLTEEHKMFQAAVRDFATKEIEPIAAQVDKEDRIPDLMGLVKKCADLGVLGLTISEEYGGSGGDYVSKVIAAEELSRASSGVVTSFICGMSFGCYPIYKYGNDEHKRKFVTPLAKGEKLGCGCFTEPDAGSDLGALQSTATRQGDSYILNGNKVFITNAEEAHLATVFASTNRSLKHRGISCFVVEKGTPGFQVIRREEKMGLHGISTAEVNFDNCKIPAENRIADEGQGFPIALDTIDATRVEVAAQAIGLAQAAFDAASNYAVERVQFGQPIGRFQIIQCYLADMATSIDAARLLAYRAAFLQDNGLPFVKEASMAKLFATETADSVCNKAIQILGGYGYCKEYPVERYWRDARAAEIYEGTSEIQRLTIARFLLKFKK